MAAHKFRWGDTRASLLLPKLVLAVACALFVGAGCGESGGVADGAVVTVYVAAPLCAEAKRELAREGGRAGDVRVRVICLANAEHNRKLALAAIGANARRATEDSTTVGYIGESTRAATRFSEPILESAGVPQLPHMSGSAAMHKLLKALRQADTSSGSLRESVLDELE